jgi:hypothetical protein
MSYEIVIRGSVSTLVVNLGYFVATKKFVLIATSILHYIIKIQEDVTVCMYLFIAKSLSTCFGRTLRPSSGVKNCNCSLWYRS